MALEPIKDVTQYSTAQGAAPGLCPEAPFRLLLCAGSNRGKTSSIVNLVTEQRFYAKTFQMVFLVSPSLGIDNSLDPILAHMKRLGQDTEEDAIDKWDDRWLREKLEHHKAVVANQKTELKHKKVGVVCSSWTMWLRGKPVCPYVQAPFWPISSPKEGKQCAL